MISGILISVLMLAFIGITFWAYSSRQQERFRQAAQLPFEDEYPAAQRQTLTPASKPKVQP
jgi:cytochrome c oxidase cbb3-type subunit 4